MFKFSKKFIFVMAALFLVSCGHVAAEKSPLKNVSDGIVLGFRVAARATESTINAVASTMSEYSGISLAVGIPLTIWGLVKLVRFAEKCEVGRLKREAAMLSRMNAVEREQYWNNKQLQQQRNIEWQLALNSR